MFSGSDILLDCCCCSGEDKETSSCVLPLLLPVCGSCICIPSDAVCVFSGSGIVLLLLDCCCCSGEDKETSPSPSCILPLLLPVCGSCICIPSDAVCVFSGSGIVLLLLDCCCSIISPSDCSGIGVFLEEEEEEEEEVFLFLIPLFNVLVLFFIVLFLDILGILFLGILGKAVSIGMYYYIIIFLLCILYFYN